MILVGIDAGLTGAAAFIDSRDGGCVVEDLPTKNLAGDGLIKRRIDGYGFALMLRKHCAAGQPVLVLMEQVGAMGGKNNAVQTQVSLGRSLGALEAAIEILRLPLHMVQPQTWKRFFGLGSDKAESLRVARALYPDAPLELAKHHNRAESVLIAHYGLRKLT
jgi:hypothetical protein